MVSLADTGASTSLLTRESADRIRIFVREANIELRGLKGPASTVGEAYVFLQVSGMDMKRKVRVILVESLPEGQEMLLACKDLKLFGLVHPEFPKPYIEGGGCLRLPPSAGRVRQGYGGREELRRMEDAFIASEVDSEPLTIDSTLFRPHGNGIRFLADYTGVNKVLKRNIHHFPAPQQVWQSATMGSKCFLAFDL